MTRDQLEHVIRVSGGLTNSLHIMVVGSQSILGACPGAPAELTMSMEADVYPLHAPERAELIEGSIGEGSPFQSTYGYYAQGVGPETATLPAGWQERVVAVKVESVTGYCLEPHDLAAAKLVAGREKDGPFVLAMLRHGIIQGATLMARLGGLPIGAEHRERLRLWLAARLEELGNGAPGPRAPADPAA